MNMAHSGYTAIAIAKRLSRTRSAIINLQRKMGLTNRQCRGPYSLVQVHLQAQAYAVLKGLADRRCMSVPALSRVLLEHLAYDYATISWLLDVAERAEEIRTPEPLAELMEKRTARIERISKGQHRARVG